MQAQIKVGRIAGISIGLHYSWFIIAVLIALSLAGHFHSVTPRWSDTVVWSSAIITGLLFFAALLSHEMAHSLVAKAYGLPVLSDGCLEGFFSRRHILGFLQNHSELNSR